MGNFCFVILDNFHIACAAEHLIDAVQLSFSLVILLFVLTLLARHTTNLPDLLLQFGHNWMYARCVHRVLDDKLPVNEKKVKTHLIHKKFALLFLV